MLLDFQREAQEKWDFKQITQDALISQRTRRFVWGALKTGEFVNFICCSLFVVGELILLILFRISATQLIQLILYLNDFMTFITSSPPGKFTSWDFNPIDDGREKYIRSHMPLDDLELRARYPAVDENGREK